MVATVSPRWARAHHAGGSRGGAAGLPGHGRSRRLALPSPKRIRHGTPRALMGRLDGRWDVLVGALSHPRRARAAYGIQSSAVSAVRLKGRGIVRGPPEGRCVVEGRPCGCGGVGQFPRTRSRFDRPSRLDSRSAIFRTGRRLASPRGATRRKERERIPTGRRTLAGRRRLMTTMERFGRKNAEMTSPCSSAGSTTSC